MVTCRFVCARAGWASGRALNAVAAPAPRSNRRLDIGCVNMGREAFTEDRQRQRSWLIVSSPLEGYIQAMTDADVSFLARQTERLMTDVGSLRDDVAVLTAIVLRLDGSMTALLQEMRATHAQIGRMNDRIRKLEDGGQH